MAQRLVIRNLRLRWLFAAVICVAVIVAFLLATSTRDSTYDRPPSPSPSSKPWQGLSISRPGAYLGYTLFAPMKSKTTYLLDMQGRVVHQWEAESNPALVARLLENGHLLRPCEIPGRPFIGSGAGGRIQEFDWDGRLVWDFEFADDAHRPHHDAIELPNGNVVLIVWERKSAQEATAAGRRPVSLDERPLQADCLIEVKPTGPTTGEVVWEWHVWDHLVQDHDPTKANYGEVGKHPELIDINFDAGVMAALLSSNDGIKKLRSLGYLGGGGRSGERPTRVERDWTHFNSIDYNPELDQIVVTVHAFSELWVIDHGTTKAEAASHERGRAGKGGDLLYRWGNPVAYRASSNPADTKLFLPHNAQWIPRGLRGEGHFLVFNNGVRRPDGEYSSVEEIAPPVDANGRFSRADGKPFGPDTSVWHYSAPSKGDFYSALVSGAQRLPNGNTFICSGNNGTLFEVTPTGEIVWKYVNPVDDRPANRPPIRVGRFGGRSQFRALNEQTDPNRSRDMRTPIELLPGGLREILSLQPGQRKDLDALQKEVDAELQAMLSDDQMKRLRSRQRTGVDAFAVPGRLMTLAMKIALQLTPEQTEKFDALQARVDPQLDANLTDEQKTRLKQVRDDVIRGGSGPVGGGIPPGPGGPLGGPHGGGSVFRAYRYSPDYPGLAERDLTPGKTVEALRSNVDTNDK